jgi:hypothetical protein
MQLSALVPHKLPRCQYRRKLFPLRPEIWYSFLSLQVRLDMHTSLLSCIAAKAPHTTVRWTTQKEEFSVQMTYTQPRPSASNRTNFTRASLHSIYDKAHHSVYVYAFILTVAVDAEANPYLFESIAGLTAGTALTMRVAQSASAPPSDASLSAKEPVRCRAGRLPLTYKEKKTTAFNDNAYTTTISVMVRLRDVNMHVTMIRHA